MSTPIRSIEGDPAVERIAGMHILVLNWRDVRHPQAGGAEQYMHEISRRWVRAGARVTWYTSRPDAQPATEEIDGVRIRRAGGALSLYPRAALRMLARRGEFDVVLDCQNGIPFFAPLFVGVTVPVIQVVHHVHQEQFSTRFAPPMAAVGRALEGPVARAVYGTRAIAAVSPSTRAAVRTRLKLRGPIFVVPNGTIDVPAHIGPRDPDPTIVLVSRLVPHKRIDLLLGEIAAAARAVPRLHVDIVGSGPEQARIQALISDLGLAPVVTLHGYLPDDARDALLGRAWLTTSTSAAEGWGCSVIEAAAWGVPCAALNAPGIRDSVLDGHTGWLAPHTAAFGDMLIEALHALADENRAREMSLACQVWARCFTWDRSAELLAGVVAAQHRAGPAGGGRERRRARSDLGTLARFRGRPGADLLPRLRATDQVHDTGETISVLLAGCDEADADALLRRHGIVDSELRLLDRYDLLAGPGADDVRALHRAATGPW
jgi:glycosyltransferase involved in cell wall biosynthesis